MTTRPARPADAATMARTTALEFETYRAFGGSGRAPVVSGPPEPWAGTAVAEYGCALPS